jgi:dTDP-glucose pyrophosphorylase
MQSVILAAGSTFINDSDAKYPISMTEFNGKPLVQWIIEDLLKLPNNKIVVVVNQDEINRYHIDRTLKLIEPNITVVGVQNNLGGAACSALIGLQYLNQAEEVILINGNEKLTENHLTLVRQIHEKQTKAAIVSFDSIHPRYSYAKIDRNEHVIEISEKDPISRNALVGFFWFSNVALIESAIKRMILKGASLNGIFYLSPAINEIILEGIQVALIKIDNSNYHPMKSEWQLNEYAKNMERS